MSQRLSIAVSELLDDPAFAQMPAEDLGVIIRLAAACARAGHNGIEIAQADLMMRHKPSAEIVDRLRASGALTGGLDRYSLTDDWLARLLPPQEARRVTRASLAEVPTTAQLAVASQAAAPAAPPGEASRRQVSDQPRLPSPKGPRDLVGSEVERFQAFWDAFGHKAGRAEAIREWVIIENQALRDRRPAFDRILRAAEIECYLRSADERRSAKHAQGWLSSRRYEDELYDHDPRAWTADETALLGLFAEHPIFERWDIPTLGRKRKIGAALVMKPDLKWWADYIRLSVRLCDWGPLKHAGTGRVSLAAAMSEGVITRHREALRSQRAQALAAQRTPPTAPHMAQEAANEVDEPDQDSVGLHA